MTDEEFVEKAILGIDHDQSKDKTDCIFYGEDKMCHWAEMPTYCTTCGCYQSKRMCAVCKHFSECNTDITGEVCERYERER